MKRIIIIGLTCIMTFNLSGCSKTALEKGPVVVTDTPKDNIDVSEPQTEQEKQSDQDNQSGQDKQDQQTGTESNIEDTTDDTSSNTDKDSKPYESETFTGVVMLEGMEEEVNYRTYYSEYGYQMNYDVDRFTVTSKDGYYDHEVGIDTYMAENVNPDIYPYVYVTITKSEFADGYVGKIDYSGEIHVHDTISGKILSTMVPMNNVQIGNYDATHYEYIGGNEWNSLVRHIYIISLEKNYYVIETNYFLEASEGFGTRIRAMLDTFVIEE